MYIAGRIARQDGIQSLYKAASQSCKRISPSERESIVPLKKMKEMKVKDIKKEGLLIFKKIQMLVSMKAYSQHFVCVKHCKILFKDHGVKFNILFA